MTTATTAVSVVDIGTTFRVTHDYHPSPSTPNAYEVSVSVKNISATATHLRYRRVMDWDIEPTAFSEFVTLFKGSSPFLDFTSNNGFATSDPLSGPSDLGQTGSFTDAGPADHGALFDFDFGSLAAGATREFKTFYGSAATETGAINALNAVGVEAYSLGEPSTPDGPTLGTPNTFLFGFRDIGGIDVFAPTAVNDSLTTAEDTAGTVNGADQRHRPERRHPVGHRHDQRRPRHGLLHRSRRVHLHAGRQLRRPGLVHLHGQRRERRHRHRHRQRHRHPGQRRPGRGRRQRHHRRGHRQGDRRPRQRHRRGR